MAPPTMSHADELATLGRRIAAAQGVLDDRPAAAWLAYGRACEHAISRGRPVPVAQPLNVALAPPPAPVDSGHRRAAAAPPPAEWTPSTAAAAATAPPMPPVLRAAYRRREVPRGVTVQAALLPVRCRQRTPLAIRRPLCARGSRSEPGTGAVAGDRRRAGQRPQPRVVAAAIGAGSALAHVRHRGRSGLCRAAVLCLSGRARGFDRSAHPGPLYGYLEAAIGRRWSARILLDLPRSGRRPWQSSDNRSCV